MKVLVATGDIGGEAACIPVINELGKNAIVVERNSISEKIDDGIKTITEERAELLIRNKEVHSYLWTTSVKDCLPLKLARLARANEVKVFCLLDNWMNYKMRLEIDNQSTLLPDYYLMMDELAVKEAIKDGIPEKNLMITGQPALAAIANRPSLPPDYREKVFQALKADNKKSLICFVSEPAESDQGANLSNPKFRGYTESLVLTDFLTSLQSYAKKLVLAILPHPREDKENLRNIWNRHKGNLQGGILTDFKSNDIIRVCDGVSGMASILLYEAWLQAKPTLSMQPNLRKEDLATLEKREGVLFLREPKQWQCLVNNWSQEVLNPNSIKKRYGKDSLSAHVNAASLISSKILER